VVVEQPSETIYAALSAYEDACQRFQFDAGALFILRSLHVPLDRLQDRLESALDDEEVCRRIDDIIVGSHAHGRKLLEALESDVQSVSIYLQNLGQPGQGRLEKDDVDVYIHALFRYSEVLTLARKKNTQYV
jgi:hypothetical protein